MIFAKRFAAGGQTHELTIDHAASGWVAREQHDQSTRTSIIRDWRHVEATMALFELKVAALRDEGWAETAPSL
jgi:hypothetical protein